MTEGARERLEEDLGCPALVELVTDYIEGALSADDRSSFEEHLAICPGCVVYIDQYRKTIAACGKITQPPAPEEVRLGLLAVYRRMRAGKGEGSEGCGERQASEDCGCDG